MTKIAHFCMTLNSDFFPNSYFEQPIKRQALSSQSRGIFLMHDLVGLCFSFPQCKGRPGGVVSVFFYHEMSYISSPFHYKLSQKASNTQWQRCTPLQNTHILPICSVFSSSRALPLGVIYFFEMACSFFFRHRYFFCILYPGSFAPCKLLIYLYKYQEARNYD